MYTARKKKVSNNFLILSGRFKINLNKSRRLTKYETILAVVLKYMPYGLNV